jgi:hypothetical protein
MENVMRDNEESAAGENPTEEKRAGAPTNPAKSFPTQAVVGVIDGPEQAMRAADELRAAGLEPEILCSARGVELIKNAGGSPRDVREIRMAQNLFGYEAEHTERHMAELEAGHFLLLTESRDDAAVDRIGEIFSENGGRFVNYYSKWTSRVLIP